MRVTASTTTKAESMITVPSAITADTSLSIGVSPAPTIITLPNRMIDAISVETTLKNALEPDSSALYLGV